MLRKYNNFSRYCKLLKKIFDCDTIIILKLIKVNYKKERSVKDLTKGNIYKTFFLFGLPLVLSGVLSQSYHIVDTIIAGKYLGEKGLASMGAVSPMLTFVSSVFWGLGAGYGVYIARLFGQKEYVKIKQSIYSAYVYLFLCCLLVGGALILCNRPIFQFLKIAFSLKAEAFGYYAVYLGGICFILANTWGMLILTGLGVGSFPFYMSLISAVVNVAGNLLCVAVLKTGVIGLAISTVVASGLVDICYVFKFRKCFAEMGVAKERVKISFRAVCRSFPYSIPNCLQQSVMYLASMLLSPLVNGLGASASASYAVVSRVYDLNASVYQNSARSISNYSAQCVGGNEPEKINKGVFVGLVQGVVFVLPFVLVCAILHKPVCSLFFKADADALTKEYAYLFCTRYLPFIFLNLLCNLFHGLFRGVKAMGHLFGCTMLASLVRYVASALLIKPLGMEGFYLGWVISWFIEAVLVIVLFYIGKWKPTKE